MIDRNRATADIAWAGMREHGIPPTPQNYEIWLSFCSGDKPDLSEQLEAVIQAEQPVSAKLLARLYRDFFLRHEYDDAVRDGACELHKVANDIVQRVLADRVIIDNLGTELGNLAFPLPVLHEAEDLKAARATFNSASAAVNERLRALESLLAASIQRIGDLKDKLSKAEHDAMHDALTGLVNRRYFDSALQRAALQATEQKSDLTLLLLDIDHFKRVNDTLGHAAGDNVLRLVARALLGHFKGKDTVARYGGEEFAIILPSTAPQDASIVAEQFRALLERRELAIRASGKDMGSLTCSIGVGTYRLGEPVDELVSRVDKRLYQAKDNGRNRVCDEDRAEPASTSKTKPRESVWNS